MKQESIAILEEHPITKHGIEISVKDFGYDHFSNGDNLSNCTLIAKKGNEIQEVMLDREHAKPALYVNIFSIYFGLEHVSAYNNHKSAQILIATVHPATSLQKPNRIALFHKSNMHAGDDHMLWFEL